MRELWFSTFSNPFLQFLFVMDDAEVTDAVLLFFEDDWAARTAVKNLRPFVDYLCHFVIAFVVFTVIVVVIIVVIVDMTIIAVNVGTIIWN